MNALDGILRRRPATATLVGGALVVGQYPVGHSGERRSALRLNWTMSHCAMRMCSTSCQGE